MNVAVLDPASLPRTSWRNGTGATRVVASGQERDVSWRVSLADIDGPCRFSRFADTWRWSSVTSGTGLSLSVDGSETQVRPGQVVDYSGESAVRARPLPGSDLPVEVLNLMVTGPHRDPRTRPRDADLRFRQLDGPVTWSTGVVAVLVLDGAVLTDGSEASAGRFLLAPGCTGTAVAARAHCVELVVGA